MKKLVVMVMLIVMALSTSAQVMNELERQRLKGKIRAITEYEYDLAAGGSRTLRWKTITAYNSSGNQLSFTSLSAEERVLSRSVFMYDSTGAVGEELRNREDGSLIVKVKYVYDDHGYKTEETNYDVSGTLFMKSIPRYDKKHNRNILDSYNEFGGIFLKSVYKFDQNGHEIEKKEYDSHHGLKFRTTYQYSKFDKTGNWQERTLLKNGEPAAITVREIQY